MGMMQDEENNLSQNSIAVIGRHREVKLIVTNTRRRGIENLTGKRQLAPQMQKGQGTCSRMTGSCRCDDPCATMILEVVEAGTFVKRKKDKAEQLRKSNTLMMTCT